MEQPGFFTRQIHIQRRQEILAIIQATPLLVSFLALILLNSFLLYPDLWLFLDIIYTNRIGWFFFLLGITISAFLFWRFPVTGSLYYKRIHQNGSEAIRNALDLEQNRFTPSIASPDPRPDSLFSELIQDYLQQKKAGLRQPLSCTDLLPGERWFWKMGLLLLLFLVPLAIWRWTFILDSYKLLISGQTLRLARILPTAPFSTLQVRILPPSYIQNEKSAPINLLRVQTITALPGSRLLVSGTIDGYTGGKIIYSANRILEEIPLTKGSTTHSFEAALATSDRDAAFVVELTDQKKESNRKSRIIRIKILPDYPPKIKILRPEHTFEISYGSSLMLYFEASDDQGIMEIILHHRDPLRHEHFFQDKILYHPHGREKRINQNHIWNPIIRGHGKIKELAYPPGTKKIEYFLQVLDNNLFSGQGKGSSQVQELVLQQGSKEKMEALRYLDTIISLSKELLENNDSATREKLQKKLDSFPDDFIKKYQKILPMDRLAEYAHNLARKLQSAPASLWQEDARNWSTYLENYQKIIAFQDALQKKLYVTQSLKMIEYDYYKKKDSTLRRRQMEALDKDFDLGIHNHEKFSRLDENMEELFSAILTEQKNQLEILKKNVEQIAAEAIQSLKAIETMREELEMTQDQNLKNTWNRRHLQALDTQAAMQSKINPWHRQISQLSSRVPFINRALQQQSSTVNLLNPLAVEALRRKNWKESEITETQILNILRQQKKSIQQAQNQMKDIRKGEFGNLMPDQNINQMVLIPKEATYTVPLELKEKIMKQSNQSSDENYLPFWRELLQ